ncbi:MAG: hypothetical protein MAGBODY4_01329 [Candidatus Marinimicrobia bacterium]|nr:hypothetical protein [Candidatus Neomarinimicrobiota bacterium]
MTLSITVKNQGTAETDDYVFGDVFFNLANEPDPAYGDTPDNYFDIGYISAGASESATLYITYDSYTVRGWVFGSNTIQVYVDYDEYVTESNENNNSAELLDLEWIQAPVTSNCQWPIADVNTSHNLNSVPNEYRSEGGLHTHHGIDIDGWLGTDVLSVSSGRVRNRGGESLRLMGTHLPDKDNFEYVHLQEMNYAEDDWVYEKGIKIGETNSDNHLHFNDETQFGNEDDENLENFTNPLFFFRLDPPFSSDWEYPVIDGSYLVIREDQSSQTMEPTSVSGQADFIIRAKDILNGLRGGLAYIGYQILDSDNTVVFSADNQVNLATERVYTNAVIEYLYPQAPNSYIYYFITNDITDATGTGASDFEDAFDSTQLPDGNYTLRVSVEDFNQNSTSADFAIIIDNSAGMGEGMRWNDK